MKHKNDYAKSGGSRNHFLPAGRRFGCGRAGLIFFSLAQRQDVVNGRPESVLGPPAELRDMETQLRLWRASLCCLAAALGFATPTHAAVLDLHVSCGLPRGESHDGNVARGTFHGQAAIRFRLDESDAGQCPADIRRGNYNRAELSSDDLPRDRLVRIAFDVFIPAGFPATGGIVIGQFHQRRLNPLALLMASERDYRVNLGSGLRALGAVVARREALFGSVGYGRWHAIVMEGRFVRNGGGSIRVFADGALRFEATGRTVEAEPYFKIGLYARRDRIAGPLTVYVTPPNVTVE